MYKKNVKMSTNTTCTIYENKKRDKIASFMC